MASSVTIGIDSMPEEIQDQIIRNIPIVDLPKVLLATRTFCRLARPHLYQSIHYIDGRQPSSARDVASVRYHDRAFNHRCSARIVRLCDFWRTITESPALVSFINQASFSSTGKLEENELAALKKCVKIVCPSNLHLALPYKYSTLARMTSVTSMDLTYPSEGSLIGLQHGLRNRVYSIFMIDSLRDLTLRCARSWQAFGTMTDADKSRDRTSNVVSLSLPDTVPMNVDLAEILTCISSQKESLEELYYNHEEDCRGADSSTFDPILMRQFSRLKCLYVPRHCFADRLGAPHPLYTFLPPKIEAITLDQDGGIGHDEYEARLRVWLQDILDHKQECYPLLKTVVLSQWEGEAEDEEYRLEEAAVLERLSLGTAFEEAEVHFEFHFEG